MDEATSRAWVDVDLGALTSNARRVARHAGKPVLPMVKADAYGLGAVACCRALESIDPWGYGVATLDEAAELRESGISRRVLVFSPLLPGDLEPAWKLRVTPVLGDASDIGAWSRLTKESGAWHLAVDTGMHRAGVEWDRIGDLIDAARRHPPEGAFTHFHSADLRDGSAEVQEKRFRAAISALPVRPGFAHCENSPGIDRHQAGGGSEWDIVRPGVFLYGARTPGASLVPEPVAHVRARVLELRDVARGEGVSYGATWRAPSPRRIATLAIGYADGFGRAFSNLAGALLHGRLVPVVGRVTMDMTMIDVTGSPCARGDVATLLGRADGAEIDLAEMAAAAGVIAYDVLVGLRLRMPRVHHGAVAV